MTYREALNLALREEMHRDPSVFLMGEDIGTFDGAYKVTQGLLAEFGEWRVRDTPIAEEGFVGAGVGAAMVGLRPVVELMTINFILVALDQIINNAAKIHYMYGGQDCVPLVIRSPQGGGQQLGAQHSQSFDAYFAYVPGLKVVAPATPADARGMLKTAIRDDNPVIFLENLALYNSRGEVPLEEYTVPFGQARIARPGRDVTVIAHSRMVLTALEASRILAEQGIEVEVVDLRSIRPLDLETPVNSIRKTNRALVVSEEWRAFGTSAEIAASLQEEAFDYLDAPIGRLGTAETPMPYSKPMEIGAIPSAAAIVDMVRALAPKGRRYASS